MSVNGCKTEKGLLDLDGLRCQFPHSPTTRAEPTTALQIVVKDFSRSYQFPRWPSEEIAVIMRGFQRKLEASHTRITRSITDQPSSFSYARISAPVFAPTKGRAILTAPITPLVGRLQVSRTQRRGRTQRSALLGWIVCYGVGPTKNTSQAHCPNCASLASLTLAR